jgi:LPS sulfotransferase NodH
MWLDPRNGPEWDLPAPQGPQRSYVVASSPRTGSTLLCRALWDSGLAGAPKEYLNPMQLRDWELRFGARRYGLVRGPLLGLVGRVRWPEERLAAHLERVRVRRSSGGWFGLKLHGHHRRRCFGEEGPERALGPVRWIHIARLDRLDQAISWARAEQTGSWSAQQAADLPPVYSARRIRACLDRIEAQEADWEAFFERQRLRPLRLTYEDLVGDLAGTLGRVSAYLELPRPVASSRPPTVRQADELSAVWKRRFLTGQG